MNEQYSKSAVSGNERDGLYHVVVGIPQDLVSLLPESIKVGFTRHARKALPDDRYWRAATTQPNCDVASILYKPVPVVRSEIIELEVVNGRPVKVVLRRFFSNGFDAVLVIAINSLQAATGTVKTIWLNRAIDQHRSLRQGNYRKP